MVSNKVENLDQKIKRLDEVSSSYCLLKWLNTTVHLQLGKTHSCHLPSPHKIPLNEVKDNPAALHNTKFKKEQRAKMLKGDRPSECKACWDIEDLNKNTYSDRQLSVERSWVMDFFDRAAQAGAEKDVNPSYLEVSFSSVCNLKCSYCGPSFSSSWDQELKKLGGYKLSKSLYFDPSYNNDLPLDNASFYIDAFWKWWPTLKKDLRILRITGGEPLLSEDTFKLLNSIKKEPLTKLELSINSNLSIPDSHWQRFLTEAENLVNENKIEHLFLQTSIDGFGEQAEYMRNGLSFKQFEMNIEEYLEKLPNCSISFACTFNALSVVSFKKLVKWVVALRKKYASASRGIRLDLPHLRFPTHQSCLILTKDYIPIVEDVLEYMYQNQDQIIGVRKIEILKTTRILEWMKKEILEKKTRDKQLMKDRRDFYLFFREHDKRRGTNFIKTFPEMKKFYRKCRNEHLISSIFRD